MTSKPRSSSVLTKSKLKQNKQCSKLLYFQEHHPELKETSSKDQTVFKIGREVEQLVRNKFEGYVLVDALANAEKLVQTKKFLEEKKPYIAEASFYAKDVHVQFDMLELVGENLFDAHEVKSSSKEKNEYLEDMAIQYFTAKAAGITIRSYYLWYINKYGTKENLFTKVDLTEKIQALESVYEDLRQKALETFNATQSPEVKIGSQCSKPYGCPFRNQCWKAVNETDGHVLKMPYSKQKWDLYNKGVESIFDERVQSEKFSNPKIIEAMRTKSLWIDKEKILAEINSWAKPLHFLDFESIMHYLPLFEGSRPYQNVVVQFSLHQMGTLNTPPSKANHEAYLHEDYSSPVRPLSEKMLNLLGTEGAIVSYNKTFEITRIKEMAEAVSGETKEQLLALIPRFVDLMDVIKDYVYHPDFDGSYSLKQVSPTLLGYEAGGYTDSLIKSGSEITAYYLEFLDTDNEIRRAELKAALLKYCGYDTLNLILLMQWLLGKCHEKSAA